MCIYIYELYIHILHNKLRYFHSSDQLRTKINKFCMI